MATDIVEHPHIAVRTAHHHQRRAGDADGAHVTGRRNLMAEPDADPPSSEDALALALQDRRLVVGDPWHACRPVDWTPHALERLSVQHVRPFHAPISLDRLTDSAVTKR